MVANGVVYATVRDGSLVALDANTGSVLANFQTDGCSFPSTPAITDGALFIGSSNGTLYKLWYSETQNTPVGNNVQVNLDYGVTLNFSQVISAGDTTIITSAINPGPSTGVFQVTGTYHNIATTASYSGPITVSLHYDDTGMTPAEENNLRILHWNTATVCGLPPPPAVWIDTAAAVDVNTNTITASVSSLDWFTITHAPGLTWLPPITNIRNGEIYTLNDGSTLPIKFSLQDDAGNSVYDSQVGIEVVGNGGKITFVPGSGDDNIRYDSSTGEYLVNLHTSNYPFMTPGPIYTITVYSASAARSLDTVNFILISGGKATGKNS